MRNCFRLIMVLLFSSVAVNAQTISGTLDLCLTGTTLLSGSPTGGTWVSGNPAVATVGSSSGVVFGMSLGTSSITYTTGTGSVTATVVVHPLPASITGSLTVCAGSLYSLACATPGVIWSSSNVAVASVDPTTGDGVGISAGTATISCTGSFGCASTAILTVNPLPAPITGAPSAMCVGNTAILASATPGGVWSSTNAAAGTVSASGTVTALSGVASTNIYYTLSGTGCATFVAITMNPVPAAITGSSTLCVAATLPLSTTSTGGTWYSSNPSIATVGMTSGAVNGMSSGTANIVYQFPTGCNTTKPVTVNPLPSAITGPGNICAGASGTYLSAPAGGSFTTASTSVLSITAGGLASGLSAGVGNITYTLSSTGCAISRPVTVNVTPGPITGNAPVCPGNSVTLSNTVAGGVWISDATSIATVSSGGGSSTTLTGIAGGTAHISYVIGGACMSIVVATVNPAPSAGILSGPTIVCTASSITLASTVAGGAWSSSSPTIGTVNAISGAVMGISAGTTLITYTVTTGCGTATANRTVTVSPVPSAITGTALFCRGTNSTLADAVPGGTWSTGASTVATVGLTTGIVSGVGAGTATIFYSISSGCFASRVVTVDPAPGPIGGGGSLCVGDVLALTDTAAGGTWGSSSTGTATIATVGSSTSVVTGISAGVAVITYAIGSCIATTSVTVNPLPVISSSASPDACGGTSNLTASGGVSYVWSPSAGLSCSTCSFAICYPVGTTTYTVTGTDVLGCSNTATITVNGDRIGGHVTFSASAPAIPDVKVWLIQFNPADSSLIAIDSVMSCLDGAEQYFQFDTRPAGRYYVKAKHLGSIPGISGYVPTYGASTPNWINATAVTHTPGVADIMNISMVYASFSSGPGSISGFVYSGAGKGTSGEVPEAGMLVYLKDAVSGQVVNHTYTSTTGAYSFSSVAPGSYIVYPEDYVYYTTPSVVIAVSAAAPAVADVTFKKNTTTRRIYPFSTNGVGSVAAGLGSVSTYPNPANDLITIRLPKQSSAAISVSVSDLSGRVVMSEEFTGNASMPQMNIASLNAGMYLISVHSAEVSYMGRFVVER